MVKFLATFALVTLLAFSATICFGQPLKMAPADAIQQQEIGNLATGDGFIHIFNSGANAVTGSAARMYVQVYTFAPDAQLISCCTCQVVPDQNVSLSARNDLISNTLTPAVPTSINVKLIATKGGDAGTDQRSYGSPGFSAGMRANRLATHRGADFGVAAGDFITEEEFFNVPVSDAEYTKITQACKFIQTQGSGFGICRSCRFGTNSAVQP